ncbi:RagB/SusD family nutrient uptake outer membrane protein [Sinomicrobium pectinilyticum]|uniref:RagB/SusD family nutrient uptake outer membrane protein n=1 Tax=Sinomicrobium pectinilyticum TaxID=1084421 RepID=A0A3N0EUX4_SINP1|nr:RagB/SusD family nutrient uptake outer membrane protein [Sinomicrobium pectinilyticum]RNL91698.1 RagB/SusD family nutrient uptake outer membrane protein [Sinomicrobium pectinilyticum]
MKTYKRYGFLWTTILGLLISCESFLDEVPDNRTEIDSPEKINELLTGAYPEASYFLFTESMSDNADDKGNGANAGFRDQVNTEMYKWNDLNNDLSDTPVFFWNACYKSIAQANQALESIKEMGSGSELDAQKGEALLIRAYSHFMLATLWCKPYNPSTATSDPGIPVVTTPEKEVLKDYERGTVQEVYEQIEKDIEEGLPLIRDDYEHPKFHFTENAAKAFASRFYLFKGDWQKVIDYANDVLAGGATQNLRGWNDDYATITPAEMKIKYQSSEEPANLLITSTSSGYGYFYRSYRYALSVNKEQELFHTNTSPIEQKGWAYRIFSADLFRNIPKFDLYQKTANLSASTVYYYTMCVLLSYDEVLLNRAEAYAMQEDIDLATQDINAFLSKKINGYDPASDVLTTEDIKNFYTPEPGEFKPAYDISESQLPFIKCLSELRRKEFCHEGMRWLDNKRWNMDVRHSDFSGNISTLSGNDPRRELQIPPSAVSFGMTPNPR